MRAMKTILTIIIFGFIVINATALKSEELPEGWRFPSEDDLKQPSSPDSINFRKESATKFTKAEADFNGDGIQDYAYLVRSTKYNGQGLLVRISSNKDFKWIVLEEQKWSEEFPNVGLSMGIEIVKPQKMKTACGKGYWECSGDEEPEITLINPGLKYFHFESASFVFYWDKTRMNFRRVWISD